MKTAIIRFLELAFLCLLLPAVQVFAAGPSLLPAPNSAGLWGYVRAADGETAISPRYTRAGLFHDGFAIVHMSFPGAAYSVLRADGTQAGMLPRGDGLIDEGGAEALPPVNGQLISPAETGGRQLPGLYAVRTLAGLGVFAPGEGWALEPGPHELITFLPDGSFVFGGSGYASAAPERNLYFAPRGYVIAYVDVELKTFLLVDAERAQSGGRGAGYMAVARWSGEMLSQTPYKNLHGYAGCKRWAGLTLGGRLDVFDFAGKIVQVIPTEDSPNLLDGGEIIYQQGGTAYIFDPCTLQGAEAAEFVPVERPSEAEPEFRVYFMDGKAMLLDRQGSERIPSRYEVLLPGADGYWWGRYTGDNWVLVNAADGREIRIKEE